jgi:hypothetical protein
MGPNLADSCIRAIVKAVPSIPVVYCTMTQASNSARAASKEDLEDGEQERTCRKRCLAIFRAGTRLAGI